VLVMVYYCLVCACLARRCSSLCISAQIVNDINNDASTAYNALYEIAKLSSASAESRRAVVSSKVLDTVASRAHSSRARLCVE
jgi:hypothetical protein